MATALLGAAAQPDARWLARPPQPQPRAAHRTPRLNLVLVASPPDHGPGQHDYPAWQKVWRGWLARLPEVTVTEAWEWPSAEQWAGADAMLFYNWNHDWSAPRLRQLDDFLARGGGVLVFHSATIADTDPEQLAQRIGLAAQPGRTGYRHLPFELTLVAPADHPIRRGLPERLRFLDEPYWPLIGNPDRVEVLATAEVDGAARPLVWTFQNGKGRVFASLLGHYTWTLDDPLFRLLALRGLAWALDEPAARFERLLLSPP